MPDTDFDQSVRTDLRTPASDAQCPHHEPQPCPGCWRAEVFSACNQEEEEDEAETEEPKEQK